MSNRKRKLSSTENIIKEENDDTANDICDIFEVIPVDPLEISNYEEPEVQPKIETIYFPTDDDEETVDYVEQLQQPELADNTEQQFEYQARKTLQRKVALLDDTSVADVTLVKNSSSKSAHTCHICGKTLSGISSLKRHIRYHTGERNHKCRFCPKAFYEGVHLSRHILTHTSEKIKITESGPGSSLVKSRFQCMQCSNEYDNAKSLNSHIGGAHGKRNVCKFCNKEFARRDSLKTHMRVHSPHFSAPYICSVCSSEFFIKKEFELHLSFHNTIIPDTLEEENLEDLSENTRNLQCSMCDGTFQRETDLYEHVEKEHQGVQMEEVIIDQPQTPKNAIIIKDSDNAYKLLIYDHVILGS